MPYCTNCGKIIREGSNFCPSCNNEAASIASIDLNPTQSVDDIIKTKEEVLWGKADYWSRLFARGIDLFVVTLIANIFVAILESPFPDYLKAGYLYYWISLVSGWIIVCICFVVYDSLLTHKIGGSLGKIMFGLRVFSKSRNNLSLKKSLQRSRGFLGAGLGYYFFFPWLAIYNAYDNRPSGNNYDNLSWDMTSESVVKQKHISQLRMVILIILASLAILTDYGLREAGKRMVKDELKSVIMNDITR